MMGDPLIFVFAFVATLIFVYLIAAPLYLIGQFRYRQWRTKDVAVAPSSRVVPPQTDGAPPPYLFFDERTPDFRSDPSDPEVIASVKNGTVQLTLVRKRAQHG